MYDARVKKLPVTALIVEDEEYVLEAVTEMASRLGHRVLRARDGEEAVISMNAWGTSVEAILLDWALPLTMGGAALIEAFTQIRSSVPIIIMTGYPEAMIRPSLPERDGLYFLQKPFFPHELEALLRRIRASS